MQVLILTSNEEFLPQDTYLETFFRCLQVSILHPAAVGSQFALACFCISSYSSTPGTERHGLVSIVVMGWELNLILVVFPNVDGSMILLFPFYICLGSCREAVAKPELNF